MGMTYWIQTREGDSVSFDSDDCTMMHELTEQLDEVCRNLGVAELSSFADFTDLELHLMDDVDEDDEFDEVDFDDEHHMDRLKDKMEWFDPVAGLQCLVALRDHVQAGWNDELEDEERTQLLEERTQLLEELDGCIGTLRALPREGAQFNLAVIM